MCRAVICKTCQKPTWAGCGQHVEQALAGVPRAEALSRPPPERAVRTRSDDSSADGPDDGGRGDRCHVPAEGRTGDDPRSPRPQRLRRARRGSGRASAARPGRSALGVDAAQLASSARASATAAPGSAEVGHQAAAGVGPAAAATRTAGPGRPPPGGAASLVPVVWIRTSWAAQRTRNSSLRVESSPMRSDRSRSWGSRPASARSTPRCPRRPGPTRGRTAARGSRKTKRALLGRPAPGRRTPGRTAPGRGALVASTSRLPAITKAGTPGIASSSRRIVGRTRCRRGRRVGRRVAPAVRRRSSRWRPLGLVEPQGAARPSRTPSETPVASPRSSARSTAGETPARSATSSRRSPGTRRRSPPYDGRPACSGVIRARRRREELADLGRTSRGLGRSPAAMVPAYERRPARGGHCQ